MRPKKDDYYHQTKKDVGNPIPAVRARAYKLVFTDKPNVIHRIIISKQNELHTIRVIFSKPLIHSVTGCVKRGDTISAKSLNDIKSIIRSFLRCFGEYVITPE